MDRRTFLSDGIAAAASISVLADADLAAGAKSQAPNRWSLAIMAELQFTPGTGDRAAEALLELAAKTRVEPGCRRYIVARDLADRDRFHLSELWDDLGALAAHFATAHMADFSAKARVLGYAAPYLKQIRIAELADLRPAELKSLGQRQPG